MKIFSFLEKNKIATKETLKLFGAIIFFGFLSWFLLKHNCLGTAWGLLIIAFGGIANLYVIGFNNLQMPILAKNRRDFMAIKRENYPRNLTILDRKTKLPWLCDRFWLGGSAYSIGDFVTTFGVFFTILHFGEIILRFIKF
jgi:hypothetical protein